MDHWQYAHPVRVIAGPGALASLPEYLAAGTWLLVTSAGFTRRGVVDRLRAVLPHVTLVVHDQVTPNPQLDDLDAVTAQYQGQDITGVLALGGGSALDAGKVLSVTLASSGPQPLHRALREVGKQDWQASLPVVAIPTTAGTGAEVTPFATVWDQTTHSKYSVTGPLVYPSIALLDAELTLSLPHQETLFTGLDAVSHALESLWNVNRTPISTAFACQALRQAQVALPQVLAHPQDCAARAAMQEASMLSGLAISHTRTAIAHAISYPLTSHFGVPHGLACSFTLPALIDRFLQADPDCAFASLLHDAREMLCGLNMSQHIRAYASASDILALQNEMYHPERAGNFTGVMDSSILSESLD